MAKQTLLWTALPNGYTADHKHLRLSLLLSPRLDAIKDAPRLSTFPDFVDWPATLTAASFVIHCGSAPPVTIAANDTTSLNRVDDRLGTPDSAVWKALFPDPDRVFVEGYEFKDLSDNAVLSYAAAKMDELVRDLYSRLAATAQDQLPTVSTILGHSNWSNLVDAVESNDNDDRFTDYRLGLRRPEGQFEAFKRNELKDLKGLSRELALFQLFHTPPAKSKIEKYKNVPREDPKAYANWVTYERAELPQAKDFQKEIDFHRIIGAMSQYPTLLRLLGLVVDLEIARDAFTPTPNAAVYAEVKLSTPPRGVTRARDASPRTRLVFDERRFEAMNRTHPKDGDYRTVDGLLDLDPERFSLLQADVDGAGLKVTNFARSLARLKQQPEQKFDPVTKHERETGAPALRNAGLMLVHNNRTGLLKNSFDRQKGYNTAAANFQKDNSLQRPTLYAEDLVRGWRIDIWDDKTKKWHSLCRRVADYDLGDGEVQINVPEEEGTLRLAATKAIDPKSNPNLIWLHEALVSWTGWSLCAPPPGKTIQHHRETDPKHPEKDHTDPVGEAEAVVPPGLHLRSAFRAVAGSLPRLRYGRQYWIRARAVDLAGNSLPASESDYGPEKPLKNARPYLRYEPISAPSLALVKPTPDRVEAPREGEAMDRISVRTFNEQFDDESLSTERARRFAVPSRTTHREAEYHGLLDRNGIVDPSFFAMLAAQDNSLAEEKIVSSGPLAGGPSVETRYAVMQEGEALPYLPEPLALKVAARIFDHPTFASGTIISIPLYDQNTSWPQAMPFKIELYENPLDKPRFLEAGRTLLIPLPKAERATLRLSIKPTRSALEILGVWNWLTDAQREKLLRMARDGQHWMLTPWRSIELVHAVQKPLIAPQIVKHEMHKWPGVTHAMPGFITTCSIKSTAHLDLLAHWNEPVEDVEEKVGHNRERRDHAYTVKITEPRSYADTPEFRLEAPDLISVGGISRDQLNRKLHEFNDTRYRRLEYWFEATTAFREYMPAEVLTTEVEGQIVPTNERIKVAGPKLRTWIPSSAPPPAPEVLYVVPTFGWVRAVDKGYKSSWRRGGGLRVYLDRPWNVTGYGEMLAVVLAPASFDEDPTTQPTAQPLKNFVTQWGNDPVWLSPFVPGVGPKRANFPLARTKADPAGKWLPGFAPLEEADQPAGPFPVTGLPHPELSVTADSQARVEIAPHDVFYDEERQLWYCDIEVNWGAAYYPFIRLALARYQPVSVDRTHLSNIVLADFAALVPDRWLNVTRTRQPGTRRINVFGSTYSDSSAHLEAESAPAMSLRLKDGTYVDLAAPDVAASSVVEVWVERFYPALGEDFGWKREQNAIVARDIRAVRKQQITISKERRVRERARARDLLSRREFDVLLKNKLLDRVFVTPTLWSGTVTLPAQEAEDQTRYRLAIAEYEEYLVDDDRPYDKIPTRKDRRLVFIEHVELD